LSKEVGYISSDYEKHEQG